MKILHVITSLLPGGAETLVANLLLRFKAMGVECEIAVFDGRETPLMRQLTKGGITVHRFARNGGSPYSPAHLSKLRKLIKAGNYDIVHTHNTSAQLFAALCQRPQGTKLVTTEHNTDNRRRSWQWYRHVDRWMYGQYDKIVCISDKTADNLTRHTGDAILPKLKVITNGIDIAKYSNEIRPISKDGEVVVTMVAGFREQKDQDTLVRAIEKLPGRFRLQLVGDGIRRQPVQRLVNELGINKKVDFMGMRSDVPEILRASDITVLSSHYEGLSLASVEAMASGRPLVASDVDGLHEVVAGHGILFAEGDSDALSRILLRLSDDSDYYQSIAESCQARAKDYDIAHTTKAYYDTYVDALAQ